MEESDSTNNRIYTKLQKKLERTCWEDECRQDPKKDFKVLNEKEKK